MVAKSASARFTLVVIAVAALLAGALAPAAGAGKPKRKKIERTAQLTYLGATGVRGVQDSPCARDAVGCVVFPIEKGERYVSLDIADASGGNVWASVYIYGYSDGTDTHDHICGKSDSPLAIASGVEELVVVITQTTGGATNPCDGAATHGEVTAVFSNQA